MDLIRIEIAISYAKLNGIFRLEFVNNVDSLVHGRRKWFRLLKRSFFSFYQFSFEITLFMVHATQTVHSNYNERKEKLCELVQLIGMMIRCEFHCGLTITSNP